MITDHLTDELRHRYTVITRTLEAISPGWPFFMAEVDKKIAELTDSLITQNSEELRGRIKALRDLKDLPSDLQQERHGMDAALSEESDAAD